MNSSIRRPVTLVAVALLGLVASVTTVLASWSAWEPSNPQVLSNYPLSGGSDLDGWIYWRWETSSNYAQIYALNQASEQLEEIYVYTAAQDRCSVVDPWDLYAYEDDLRYDSQFAYTDHLSTPPSGTSVGEYQTCGAHQYRWYAEFWGVDPPPNWQWTWEDKII